MFSTVQQIHNLVKIQSKNRSRIQDRLRGGNTLKAAVVAFVWTSSAVEITYVLSIFPSLYEKSMQKVRKNEVQYLEIARI